MIKLTNASKEHSGKSLLINPRHILSVFETDNEIDEKTTERVTNIYTVTQQGWAVKETLEEIYKLIK
ncbi:hypothetical protein P19250A_0046 [Methylophilaceae phage P19250A]|nr:hypothetical protein P19250A_0046 [Methylophilaceae phage P19250A]